MAERPDGPMCFYTIGRRTALVARVVGARAISTRPGLRALLAVLFMLLLPATLHAQRRVDEKQAIRPGGMVRIHNMVGSVRVTGWDRDTIAVTGIVRESPDSRFYFGAFGDGAKLGIDESTGDLGPSDLEIRVPARSSVWVKTGSADVIISGISGGVDLFSVTGTVRIEGTPREVQAESMGGSVSVDVETRTARVRSASGDIRMRGALLDVSATTVSGTVEIEGSRIQRGRFESVDGPVRWTGALLPNASLDFITHAGGVEFTLPPAVSGEFLVNTFMGGLDNRIGAQVRNTGSKLKGSEFSFTLGNGGAVVSVRTFKGRVVVQN